MSVLERVAAELAAESYRAFHEGGLVDYIDVKLPNGGRVAMGFEHPEMTELLCTVYDAEDNVTDGIIERIPRGATEQDILQHALKVCEQLDALRRMSTLRVVAYVDGVEVGEEECTLPAHLAEHVAAFALVQGEDPDLDLAWENWNNARENTPE